MVNVKSVVIAVVIVVLIGGIASFAYISGNSHNTKIDVISNSTLKSGDYIKVQLHDEYRNVYPGEVIDIKVLDDSGWPTKYNVTTDENGVGAVKLGTLDNGNYTIHANYNGTLFNKPYHGVSNLLIDDGYSEYSY